MQTSIVGSDAHGARYVLVLIGEHQMSFTAARMEFSSVFGPLTKKITLATFNLRMKDMFTTTALTPLARPGYWEFMGGITRSLNITYLRGVPTDTTVLFRSHVVQHGKTVALVRGEMVSEDGKKVYAVADHHKVNVPMLPEHKAARVKWDDDMDKKARQPSAKGPKL